MARLELTIAPNVMFPDWTAVTSPLVKTALDDLLREDRMLARWGGVSEEVRRTHAAILQAFSQTGDAPQSDRLAQARKLAPEVISDHIADLAARDLVVTRDGLIEVAYPFTIRDTGHVVEIEGVSINAMCAIDALGAGAMLNLSSVIRSRCRKCREPLVIETGEMGQTIARQSPPTTVVWAGVEAIDGCAADTQCQSMMYFCSDEHLLVWKNENDAAPVGYRLSVAEALQAGAAIFRPFLSNSCPNS